jgi:glutathione S-transferase
LDKVLGAEPNKEWLVGDRITYADLTFVPWNDRLDVTLGVPADKKFEGFPNVKKWHERMIKRPSWIKAMRLRARLMDEHGLDWNGIPKGTTNFQQYQQCVAQNKA